MNTILRILKMPRLASIQTTLSWLLLFVLFTLAVDIGKTLPIHGAGRQFGVAILIIAILALWKMVANTLWLARDARALRLPGVERDADSTLPLFAIASVITPALILGTMFGYLLVWLVSLALLAAGALAFCILPTVLTIPVFVVGVPVLAFSGWHPPLPGDPAYLAWAVPALIVLTVASLQRWVALRRADTLAPSPWFRPTSSGGRLVQLRKLRGESIHAANFASKDKPRKPADDTLNKIGPDHPVRSIRVALGGNLMPLDVRIGRAHYQRWQVIYAVLVLALPALALTAQRYFGFAAMVRFSPQLLMLSAIAITATPINQQAAVHWRGHHAELSLLALLPHLDAATRLKRNTLAASVALNVLVKLYFAVSATLVLMVLRLPTMFFVYLALAIACGVLLELAMAANVLGGRPLRKTIGVGLYFAVIMIPVSVTTSWGMRVMDGARPQLEMLGWPAVVCIALWLTWCAGFALRGWRALQRRPHPFLPNPPA